jgi:hypothetical protein
MQEIIVEMFEYEKAKAPNSLKSGGLGPCIAVGAIYNKKGYLVHTCSGGESDPNLEQMLVDLKKDVKDATKLKIYVAGGSPDNEITLADRRITLKKIKEAGFAGNIRKIKWARQNCIEMLKSFMYFRYAEK